jgi:hypothetical protein
MLLFSRQDHVSPKQPKITSQRSHSCRPALECLNERIAPSATPLAPLPTLDLTTTIGQATSGSIVSETNGLSKYGVGSWVKSETQDAPGQETVTVTTSYSGGVQITDTDLITKNSTTGVTTKDNTITTTTNAGSQTTTRDYRFTPEGNGVVGIAEVVISAKGQKSTYTGSETTSTTSYGSETNVTLTNSADQTEHYTIERFSTGNATATETFGTTFDGKAFNTASLRTYTGVAKTNTLDSSTDGHGAYTFSESKPLSDQAIVRLNKVFDDGVVVKNTKTITSDKAGNTNVSLVSNWESADGKTFTSTTDLNYTSTGNGGGDISGVFSQSNGHWGADGGTYTKTNFGTTSQTTETDEHGVRKPLASNALTIGDAQFVVTTGVNFYKQTVNKAVLTTGVVVTTPE